MKLVLKGPNEVPYEAGKDINVVIACEDSATVATTCEFLELFEHNLKDEGRLFYQWWNFEVLANDSLRHLAAAEAAAADTIIIAFHEGLALPREVTDWMKQWLGLRKDRAGALVALLDRDLKSSDAPQGILSQLEQAATVGHMDFFATRAKVGRNEWGGARTNEAVWQFVNARKPVRNTDCRAERERPSLNIRRRQSKTNKFLRRP